MDLDELIDKAVAERIRSLSLAIARLMGSTIGEDELKERIRVHEDFRRLFLMLAESYEARAEELKEEARVEELLVIILTKLSRA